MRYRTNAMIVAPQPEAAEAGAEILRAGGNAVDAAIACALVQGVVDPLMCGIAGFGSCGIYMPAAARTNTSTSMRRRPRAARPDMWADLIEGEARDGFGFILKGRVNDVGYQSICVPGSLRAYHGGAIARTAGCRGRRSSQPAIAWARERLDRAPARAPCSGPTRAQMGRASNPERLRFTPSGPRALLPSRRHAEAVGDRVREPRLWPRRCERIAKRRRRRSSTRARSPSAIAADMRGARRAARRCEDLAAADATRNAPLWGTYRGYRVSTNRPPGGGVMLLEMLNILEQFDLAALGHNSPDYIRVVAEAMKRATIDKDRIIGDPAFVDVPLDRLIVARITRASIAAEHPRGARARRAALQRRRHAEHATRPMSPWSTRDGNCVTMTHSLGMPSGVITDGPGLHVQRLHGRVRPAAGPRRLASRRARRRFSSIVPDDRLRRTTRPHIVIGAPGGTQIAMGVLQGIAQRARLRHDDGRGGERAALLRDQQRDRRLEPHPAGRAARPRGHGL